MSTCIIQRACVFLLCLDIIRTSRVMFDNNTRVGQWAIDMPYQLLQRNPRKGLALHSEWLQEAISTTHTANYSTHDSPSSVFAFFDCDAVTTMGTA